MGAEPYFRAGVNPTGRLSATFARARRLLRASGPTTFPSSVPIPHSRRYGVRPREAGGTPASVGGLNPTRPQTGGRNADRSAVHVDLPGATPRTRSPGRGVPPASGRLTRRPPAGRAPPSGGRCPLEHQSALDRTQFYVPSALCRYPIKMDGEPGLSLVAPLSGRTGGLAFSPELRRGCRVRGPRGICGTRDGTAARRSVARTGIRPGRARTSRAA
jgi:hypothetical protein